jgi:hypothetical protein
MMADPDLSNLKPLLDEHEKYAKAIGRDDARFGIAQQMLGIIVEANRSLHPSADSTANYVPSRQIIEDLTMLRSQAEQLSR